MKRIYLLFTFLMTLAAIGAANGQAFITTWKTDNPGTSNDDQITIPTTGSDYNYTVTWGDGSSNNNVSGDITHTYLSAGTYTVSITGDFPRIYFNNAGDKEKILTIEAWGAIAWTSMEFALAGCTNLSIPATDSPDLTNATSLRYMFNNATSFNDDLNNWDVSTITNMFGLFYGATSFNGDISDWDVSNVTTMQAIFGYAYKFNQDIGDWEVGKVTQMKDIFFHAYDFNQDISGWDVSKAIVMRDMFNGASSFNQDIGGWNVESATNMIGMFQGASSFDRDLGGWNITMVTDMSNIFSSSDLSTKNYDNILKGWSALAVQSEVGLGAAGKNYCHSSAERDDLINSHGWNISDAGQMCLPFTTTWKTDNTGDSDDDQITIPTTGTGYNYSVDWGDGSSDDNVTGNITHTYTSPGTYTVLISGDFPRIYFNDTGDKAKILTIEQWGNNTWTSMQRAFYGCVNLTVPATDAPDLSEVTYLSAMFKGASSLNQNIGHWDVSNILYMDELFMQASTFNQDISSWDVTNVKNMFRMFSAADAFNQEIGNWDVGNVTAMGQMFASADAFNADIGNWNVSKVTNMGLMFILSGFNQDIGNWDVSKVTYMRSLFSSCPFNQDISDWNVSSSTDMNQMFAGNTSFNQDIGKWDVSNVTDMALMFSSATSFDQDISGWNVGKVTSFQQTFSLASSFNQDLSNWNVSSVTNMDLMFNSSALSIPNYDKILNSWSGLALQSDVVFGAQGVNYCLGAEARDILINSFNWTITDAGENCIVNIPDANFKAVLLANTAINTTDDGEITYGEAEAYSGALKVDNQSIAGLTGIEAFSNIVNLDCGQNSLTEVDVSNNTNLKTLWVDNNDLTSIDISGLTQLVDFRCGANGITSLDLSNNTEINVLIVSGNELSEIDVSDLTKLSLQFSCDNNDLTSLDVSNNPLLKRLFIQNNQITSLDLSNNPDLTDVYLVNNDLSSLDMRSGGNTKVTSFNATGNTNLACVTVDNPGYSSANWTSIPEGLEFKRFCDPNEIVNIPDDNFKAALLANESINTTNDGEITYGEAVVFDGLINFQNAGITDLTGLEAFSSVKQLRLSGNNVGSLDLSHHPDLVEISCGNCGLTEIDLSAKPDVYKVDLVNNDISEIDLSGLPALLTLNMVNTSISTIDFTNNPLLLLFWAGGTNLTEIDVSNLTNFKDMWIDGAPNLQSLNLANGINTNFLRLKLLNNPNLTCVTVDDPAYSETNWKVVTTTFEVEESVNFSTNCNNVANAITAFSLTEQIEAATIDNAAFTVGLEVPFGTDLTALVPAIAVSPGATINPASGVAQSFLSPVVYTVTAENPSATQKWTVKVLEENAAPTDITLSAAVIDENNTVGQVVGALTSTDANAASAHTYTLVAGDGDTDNAGFQIAGSSLAANEVFNFEVKSSYSVRLKTDDGRGGAFEKAFTISINNVNESPVVATTLADQSLDGGFSTFDINLAGVFTDIDGDELQYSVTSADETVVTAAISGTMLTITEVGAGSATLTVTATDGGGLSMADELLVTVSEAVIVSSSAKDILTFELAEATGNATIDATAHTVVIEVAAGTDVSNLAPTITISEAASISPASEAAQDFTSAVVYTVTAEDASTQEWTVTVTVEEGTETGVPEIFANINVYPNPTADLIRVSGLARGSSVQLIGLQGAVVSQVYASTHDTETINLTDLKNGVYVLKVSSHDKVKSYRIIKN
jgi:surface protein